MGKSIRGSGKSHKKLDVTGSEHSVKFQVPNSNGLAVIVFKIEEEDDHLNYYGRSLKKISTFCEQALYPPPPLSTLADFVIIL